MSTTFSLSPHEALDLSLAVARRHERTLWYSGIGVGLLAGAALSTFLWRRHLRAVDLEESPLQRAEDLIANCEKKLEAIEQSVAEIKDIHSDIQATAQSNASHNN